MALQIVAMQAAHWEAISAIYAEGIATGNATFETEVPSWEAWDSRHLVHSRLVALCDGQVAGWVALTPTSSRRVYAGVAELSIYVGAPFRGAGIGRALLEALIAESERQGIWTLQTGIFPENTGSLALHEKCGFRILGYRERVGCLHGRWRNVMLLERRSRITGVDAGPEP